MIEATSQLKLPIKNYSVQKVDELRKGVILLPEKMTYVVTDIAFSECFQMIMEGRSLLDAFRHYCDQNKEISISTNKRNYEDYLKEVFFYSKNENKVIDNLEKDINFRFDLTHNCNLHCRHCLINEFSLSGSNKDLSLDRWIEILDKIQEQVPKASRICLSGGEPFIYKDFLPLLNEIKERGYEIAVMTNGVVLYELIKEKETKKLNYILDHISHFQISLDGFDEEGMDFIRGKGAFTKVVTVIQFLRKNHKYLTEVHTTVSEANMSNLEEKFIRFLETYDLYDAEKVHYSFSMVRDLGRAKNLTLIDNVNFELFLHHLYKRLTNVFSLKKGKKFPKHFSNCGIGSPIAVSPNGELWMCGIPNTEKFGNIFEHDFTYLIDRVKAIRELTMQYNMDSCRNCELKGYCNGHCRILNKKYCGDYRQPPCNNELKKSIYISLIRRREFGSVL
jgi:radical SAM protein with 4Fe4S-binding SPASM domain